MLPLLSEAEWHVSNEPHEMLRVLEGNPCASDRKLRLYACACAEHVTSLLPNRDDYELVLATAERMAEGLAHFDEVRQATEAAIALEVGRATRADARIAAAVSGTVEQEAYRGACGIVLDALHGDVAAIAQVEPEPLAHLLRCVFGVPYRGFKVGFRLFKLDPAWRTSTVVALAQGIYDERAFDRLPILADALQDAGCDADAVLAHCRETTATHARGCWVVDAVLGKA